VKPRAFLFDAYGTLFDVHSVVSQASVDIPADVKALSALWRQKQLEYTWLRSLMERYEDFWEVTKAALHASVAHLGVEASDAQLDALLKAYLRPEVYPDALAALQTKAAPAAILSNGSPVMLESAVRQGGLEPYLADVISVDRVRTYKPSPKVYALGPEVLKLPADQILFVSSNWWDAAGAKAFGYRVCWCNRSGAPPDDMGFAPDMVVGRLDQIEERLRV
jgi:2-haloacid dehalogenase